MKLEFDLSHPSGIAGIYFLGIAFSSFATYLMCTIMGAGASVYMAPTFFTAALVWVIVGSIFLILGYLCLFLNIKRTKQGAGKPKNASMVVILLNGFTIIMIGIMSIVASIYSL